jgi:hypothetical protein
MSNFLAIAAVTEVLRELVDQAVSAAVPDFQVEVATGRPDEIDEDDGRAHVNAFLYQTMPNPALSNHDLPTRRTGGGLVARPRAALDLHYLLTFQGDPAMDVPERLLGATVAALHGRPQLDRQLIRDVIASQVGSKPFLAQVDLADQVELVKFTPLALDLEEMSKLWSIFFQVPYYLSIAYVGSVVLIEAAGSAQAALPVRGPIPSADPDLPDEPDGRNIYVDPFRFPRIDAVVAGSSDADPILAGGTIRIRGHALRGDVTGVTLNGLALDPPPDPDDREIEVPLTSPPVPDAALRAGVRGVQVVHHRLMGRPETPHRGVESNVAPFVLRPLIVSATVANVALDGDFRSAEIQLVLDPPVGKRQRAVLLLNELEPPVPPTRPARAYAFEAPSRDLPGEPDSTTALTIAVARVRPGSYLVRVQIDGAESPLTIGAIPPLPPTPANLRYVEPRIEIP